MTQHAAVDRYTLIAEVERAFPGIDAADAFSAVMCALERRLTRGDAIHLWKELPLSVRPLVAACALHRPEEAPTLDERRFLELVCAHFRFPPEQVERIARVVLSVVQSRIPFREIEDVASQLPADLELLWREAWAEAQPPAATGS